MATPYIVNWTVGLIWPGFNRPDQPREFQILRRQDRVFPWCPWWRWRAPWCAFRLTDTYAPSDDRRRALGLPIGPETFHALFGSFADIASAAFCLLARTRSTTVIPTTGFRRTIFVAFDLAPTWESSAASVSAASRPPIGHSIITRHREKP
jgi:hypothetical protein